jgi:hypothetical protein
MADEPHERARGWLNLTLAPRCGARTRRQTFCQCPAMTNGRCRLHGGLSTGPRTIEGLERSRRARWIHGAYSRKARELRAEARRTWLELRAILEE